MPLKERQRHYYEVILVDEATKVAYTGKGPSEAAARAAAKKLAKAKGRKLADLTERPVRSLVGPKATTFQGNRSVPE